MHVCTYCYLVCAYASFLQLDYKHKAILFYAFWSHKWIEADTNEQDSLLRMNRFTNFLSNMLKSVPSTQGKNQQAFSAHDGVVISNPQNGLAQS